MCPEYSAYLSRLWRADERTRIALLLIRVRQGALQGVARGCATRLDKAFFLFWFAPRCRSLQPG
jgi:hypothetical protein